MKQRIEMSGLMTAADVEQWPVPSSQSEVTFSVKRSAVFEPGAEGLALAYLSTLLHESVPINTECEFDSDYFRGQFNSTALSSAFGFALIRAAKSLRSSDRQDESSLDLRLIAGKIYDQGQGILGLGDRVNLLAFDPKRPWPRGLLKNSGMLDEKGTPLPSAFESALTNIISEMGLGSVGSRATMSSIVNFAFELFSNTLQHGRPSNPAVGKHGTRSVSVSKIAYNHSNLHARGYSEGLLGYLERNAEFQKTDKGLFVICISVMDMGDGIQNTLPAESIEEEPAARLLRAFSMGESRRNNGMIARGAGLQKVLTSAHKLGARLQVRSAGLQAVKDFSLGHDKLPNIHGAELRQLSTVFRFGTCVDIFFARPEKDLDQQVLIR